MRRTDIPCFAEFNTVTGVEGAAFSAFDFFPGGAPQRQSDASNGLFYLWSATLEPNNKQKEEIGDCRILLARLGDCLIFYQSSRD